MTKLKVEIPRGWEEPLRPWLMSCELTYREADGPSVSFAGERWPFPATSTLPEFEAFLAWAVAHAQLIGSMKAALAEAMRQRGKWKMAELEQQKASTVERVITNRFEPESTVLRCGWFLEAWHAAYRRSQISNATFGVLLVDVDHFEAINTSIGPRRADTVLNQVSQSLHAMLPTFSPYPAVVGRLPGDTFGVLVPCEGMACFSDLGERAVNCIEQRTFLDRRLSVSVAGMHCEGKASPPQCERSLRLALAKLLADGGSRHVLVQERDVCHG